MADMENEEDLFADLYAPLTLWRRPVTDSVAGTMARQTKTPQLNPLKRSQHL